MFFLHIILIISISKINNELNNILFNSIIGDNYNFTSIFNSNYYNIKVKHHSPISTNKIICIFGVLVNQKGIQIKNEMLNWLLHEYDIFIVYQKYPGKLFEYPGLRFAQWILGALNKTILLYLHTKGAFNSHKMQLYVRELWKNEFTYPRNQKYIKSILKNKTDISIPFRKGKTTWFNGMFISKRAFDLIHEIPVSKIRHFYEVGLFNSANIRIKGIINDNITSREVVNATIKYIKEQRKKKEMLIILIEIGFIIIIKYYIKNALKFFKNIKKKKK